MICFRTKNIRCKSSLTPSNCQELANVIEKSGAEVLTISLDKNSPDTLKRLFELCPGVNVKVRLGGRFSGECSGITFSPHTDSINMREVYLYPTHVTRLYMLVSLFQSWAVRDKLCLNDLGHLGREDWTELSRSLDTLNSVREVKIKMCIAPPSVSLLETLWNKTQEKWIVDDEKNEYYKENEEDFAKILKKHFQSRAEYCNNGEKICN